MRDVIKEIENDGWVFVHQWGSHRHFQHAVKSGTVTIPGRPSDEMAPKALDSIWRQAQL